MNDNGNKGSWYSQSRFDVRLEWGLSAAENLAQDVDCVVIIDVMSFSTCVSVANDNNALIYPYIWKDETAIKYAQKIGADVASVDRKYDTDTFSLSPQSLKKIPEGYRLVLPSPNGSTISFQARDSGAAVFSGCFRNMAATAKACTGFERILVIPSGERWMDGSLRPAVEDYVAAGGIITLLGNRNLSPEAQVAAAAFACYKKDDFLSLNYCSSATELKERGFETDIAVCLEYNVSSNANRLNVNFYKSVSVA